MLKLFLISLFAITIPLISLVNLTFAAAKPQPTTPTVKPTPTPPSPLTTVWKGNGTNNGVCSSIGSFDDLNPPAGQQGWLFILTSPYSSGPYQLTTTFNPATQTPSNPITGVKKANGSVHFVVYTAAGATLVSALATYGTTNSVLTVSHCETNIKPLEVSKTANTSFTRTWDWDIEKSADQTDLGTLEPEDVMTVNYTATVSATSQDSDFAVAGTINVTNPVGNPSATITGISDVLSLFGPVSNVNCGVTFPYVLTAGSTLNCTYSQDLLAATNQNNTATVTTSGLVPGGSGNANVVFSQTPSSEIDECVTVDDTNPNGPQDLEVCNDDLDQNGQKVFNYSLTFSKDGEANVELVCGENTYTNTISFVTNDTETSGDDEWAVTADVDCPTFWCSPGYWGSAAKFDIYDYINAHKVVTPPASVAATDLYSSITGITPNALKDDSPADPTISEVLGDPSIYGGPAFNSVADYFAYLLGWGGTQQTGENCPINAEGL